MRDVYLAPRADPIRIVSVSDRCESDRMTDPALQELLDKQAITERLLDYARGVDRIDHGLICSVFHPEARLDYGAMFSGTREEFAAFIGLVHPVMQTHSHHVSNIRITVDGERAGSEAYVLVWLRSDGSDGTCNDTVNSGRYVDQWRRGEEGWRIVHRRYVHGMDSTRPVGTRGFPTAGSRDASDPSYAVLGSHPTDGD